MIDLTKYIDYSLFEFNGIKEQCDSKTFYFFKTMLKIPANDFVEVDNYLFNFIEVDGVKIVGYLGDNIIKDKIVHVIFISRESYSIEEIDNMFKEIEDKK